MSEETKEILNHLIEYLQDKIDTGYHKIFYNDLMYDEKTVDCINAINDTIKEIERLNNELEEFEEFKEEHKIMKQILIENNLWETFLNDDRFLEYLRK